MNRDRIIPAREIEGLVADGHLIVIYEDYALKLDNWLDKHPGGHLAIHHVVGRDATDEINAYVLSQVKWRLLRTCMPLHTLSHLKCRNHTLLTTISPSAGTISTRPCAS